MNPTKHPRFIKDLPAANLLLAETCPLAEVILETLVFAGIDPDQPVYTRDGDRVRLLCVDHDHQFPIVGEVIDFGAETSWMARWSASGLYAGASLQSIARHSLAENAPLGGIVEPACGCVVSHEVHVDVDFALPPLRFVQPGPASMLDEFKKIEPAAKPPRTPPPPEIAMADGPSGTEISPQHTWARTWERCPPLPLGEKIAPRDCVNLGSHFRDTKAIPGGIECKGCGSVRNFVQGVDDSVANSVLSDWPLPLGAEVQAESAEVIGRAKRAVAKWTRDHAEYPNLRAIVSPLIDLTKVEEATTDAHLTPAAHLWSLVAFYAMAGRLHLGGKGKDTPSAAASMTPLDLQRIVDGCKRAGSDGTYGYWISGGPTFVWGGEEITPAKAA